jgi:hypothetical protein
MATGSQDKTVRLWKIKDILAKQTITSDPTSGRPSGVKTPKPSLHSKTGYVQLHDDGSSSGGGSIIRRHKKRSSRKLKRYASKRIKRNRNRNRNKYRKSKKAKTKRYPKLR